MRKNNQKLFWGAKLPFCLGLLAMSGMMLCSTLLSVSTFVAALGEEDNEEGDSSTVVSGGDKTGNAVISVDVKSVLTLEVSPKGTEEEPGVVNITARNDSVTTGIFTAKVSSNQGYKIFINTKDETTNLVRVNGGVGDIIPAVGDGKLVEKGTSAWGIRACKSIDALEGQSGCKDGSYKAVGKNGEIDNPVTESTTTNVFYTSNTGVSEEVTVYEIGISVSPELPSGTYTNNLVITAAQF